MSHPLFGNDVIFYQRLLKASGYYPYAIDGAWGPQTAAADAQFLADAAELTHRLGTFDPRTESHIATLHITAQAQARRFMRAATQGALTVRIISATRSYAEQNALYRQGRFGNPGPIVTKARGGQSTHNFCIAWDIGLFAADGTYLTGDTGAARRAYHAIEPLVHAVGLEWGGHWTSIVDTPHYQLPTGKGIAQVRALFEAGTPYV